MSGSRKNFDGAQGFVWFVGVVEDRFDPEQLGRVRIRCFGWHSEFKEEIPTDALPWAHTVFPTNLSNAVHTPKEGDWVFGFFLDGTSAQDPVVMGVLPGYPKIKPDSTYGFADPNGVFPKNINEQTTNRLARARTDGTIVETRKRNLKTAIKSVGAYLGGKIWDEPQPTFNPKYPFNNAHHTESGHAFELDDTAGKERVNLAHKNGSFIEMDYTGNRVEKVVKDKYTVVMGSDYVYVDGNCNLTVGGDCHIKVTGKFNVEASEINMSSSGDVKIKAAGKMKLQSGNSFDVKAGGVARIGSGGKLNLKGRSATLQGSTVNFRGRVKNKVKCPRRICKIRSASPPARSPTNSGLQTPK